MGEISWRQENKERKKVDELFKLENLLNEIEKGENMENPVKIVRYSREIKFPSGNIANIQCMMGTFEGVREKAEKIARENEVEVISII